MNTNPTDEPCRCPWVDLDKPDYVEYHDLEWGVPVHDDRAIFEFLTLEAAQAGLSWYTVLRKRENYRKLFAEFDVQKIARFNKRTVESLLKNPGIIRNRLKVEAAINNAKRFIEVQDEFGSFDSYVWQFVDGKPIVNEFHTQKDYPASTPESDAMSKDLKKRGFKFVGSTICYAHMQAAGMVNDHSVDCFRRHEIMDAYEA
ncbi:MAG: DNA-3-methyladenine glycosylase I [Planctomycetota bacterium]|nr:DNA-3-methyladenine glycosylase I [Planctomycetota bacterium]MDA1137809.1 DNA-3-methyladenine glycosylase I [Planctomycetota bacterium]